MALSSIIDSAIRSLAASLPEAASDILYSGIRGTRSFSFGAVAAMTQDVDALMSDEATTTDRARVKFYISTDAWADETGPRNGDIITTAAGKKYAVLSYEAKAASVYVVHAREAA